MTKGKRKRQPLEHASQIGVREKSAKALNFTHNPHPKKIVNHPHGRVNPDEFYAIRRILSEKEDKYEIDWEDGPNGEKFVTTWEPQNNVTMLAVQEFEQRKARSHYTHQHTDSLFESAKISEVRCEVDAVPSPEDASPVSPEGYSDGNAGINAAWLAAPEDCGNELRALTEQTGHVLCTQRDGAHSTAICPTPQKPFHEELASEDHAGDVAEQDVVLGHGGNFDNGMAGLDAASSGDTKLKHEERQHHSRPGDPGTKEILEMRDRVADPSKPANKKRGVLNPVPPGIPALLRGKCDGYSRIHPTTVSAPIITGLGGPSSKSSEKEIRTRTKMCYERPARVLPTALQPKIPRGISVPINNFFQGGSTDTHTAFHDSRIPSQTESHGVPFDPYLQPRSIYPESAVVAPDFLEPKVDIVFGGINSSIFLKKAYTSLVGITTTCEGRVPLDKGEFTTSC